jgi:putative restriction endonuclease
VSLGSFQRGIHRSALQRGPAALTLFTSPNSPYADEIDEETATIIYAYRSGAMSLADNRALDAAFEMRVPLIYFKGIEPGQYMVIAPVFVTARDRAAGLVKLTQGVPFMDLSGDGLVSSEPARHEALREVVIRLQQQRFRREVLGAYRQRCTVFALKRRELVQAAHITEFADWGIEDVTNGLALCAIHHLAYDRNLMGIDPGGVVHISSALQAQIDGPMLREGIQAFHGAPITQPPAREKRPDPARLAIRFERFRESNAA